jgi:hypothetical protein
MDLTHRPHHLLGLDRWPLKVGVTPVLDKTGPANGEWDISVVVRARLSLEAHHLQFDDLCRHGGPPATRSVHITTHIPVAEIEAVADTGGGVARVIKADQATGGYTLTVTPDPQWPVGPFRFEVRVFAIEPSGARHPGGVVTVHGSMKSPVRLVPAVVLLGEQSIGQKAEAEVSIDLPAQPGWKVESVRTDSTDTTVVACEGGTRPRYRIGQNITAAGDQIRTLTFHFRGPKGQMEVVSTEVRFYGQPVAGPTPGSLPR